ncbi:hypothetical protein HA466_0196460 [Hirschfeldia incana]|nr:hypothetical protein HA466_0196460 [Hirschfeldia incana]
MRVLFMQTVFFICEEELRANRFFLLCSTNQIIWSSVTATPISCSDQRCSWGVQSSDSGCYVQNNLRAYTFQYGDGSATSGFYVSDVLQFDMIVGGSLVPNSTAQVVFGCSTLQAGGLVRSDRAVDGIFVFGQQGMSVISQLASQGVAPRVFSHCLKGENGGGGILVLGETVAPNIVFTPLVPSKPHYNVNLLSISVNGQALPINPSVFSTSNGQGTIIDTGTTLAYLSEVAYAPFVEAASLKNLLDISEPSVKNYKGCFAVCETCCFKREPVLRHSLECCRGISSGNLALCWWSIHILESSRLPHTVEQRLWCIGFQRIQNQGITILGDLVLEDKIFVYDLVGQRIGWANYDCSMSVNVSATSSSGRSEYVNAGQFSDNAAPQKLSLNIVGNTLTL